VRDPRSPGTRRRLLLVVVSREQKSTSTVHASAKVQGLEIQTEQEHTTRGNLGAIGEGCSGLMIVGNKLSYVFRSLRFAMLLHSQSAARRKEK
jgi:hypothetical protein